MRVPQEAFQFCGPSYLAASPVIDAQRSINLYPEHGYSTSKTKMALIGRPGLSLFATMAGGPVSSIWAGYGRLFCQASTHVYEVDNAGAVVTDYGAGVVSGYPSKFISNGGTQLLVCDGSNVKLVNTVGPALTQVFQGQALEYLDGFFVSIATGAALVGSNPNQINVSANLDGTTWPALDYVLRTGSSDKLMQLATLNNLLWLFGEKSIEIWYNAGNPLFPFARVNGGTINLGLFAARSVVKFYNTLLWLGCDDRGYAQVYMAKGMSPVRVSTPAIENLLSQQTATLLPYAQAYGYQEGGHTFYVLQIVNGLGVPIAEFVYDLTEGLWHERAYKLVTGPWPMSFASIPTFGNGPNFAGDGYSGKIYKIGLSYPSDDGGTITYTRTAPHVSDSNQWIRHTRFEIDGDFGTAGLSGSALPTLDYSDDGGRNFGGRTRSMQQAASSGRGTTSPSFRRFFALQLGRSRDRVYKVTITEKDNLVRIANAYLDVEP